jgi:murein DD-endopeptidase MepM/ murein hydrolase activator NlpD
MLHADSILIIPRISVDTFFMDVITIFRPENDVMSSRSGPIESVRTAEAGFEFRVPFPYVFLLLITLLLAVSPALQNRYGFYRLERMSLGAESGAESAFRSAIFPGRAPGSAESDVSSTIPAAMRSVSYSEYKVRSGDSVSTIAARFGLKNISTILSVNGIENAKRIRVGQNLSIPSMDGIIYTVSRGESLGLVAGKFQAPVTAILDANDLESETLAVSQKLFIPGGTLSTMDLRKAMGELFVMPVRGRLTSRFGYRNDPFTGARSFHTGIDLAAPTGTNVAATLDGTVATTGFSAVYGNYVILSHGGNYQSLYAHLSAFSVKRGQAISQGAFIGKVGNTGYSTGPHLHFSVYKNGQVVDPYSVLD